MKKKHILIDVILLCIISIVIIKLLTGYFENKSFIGAAFKVIISISLFCFFLYEKTKNLVSNVYPKYFIFINPINKVFDYLFKNMGKVIGNISIGLNLYISTSQILFILFSIILIFIL